MVKHKHIPPSRKRYERSHPVISIRVDKETDERLRDLAKESRKSLATLIKENLDLQEEDYCDAWADGHSEGCDEGRRKYQVWYYCAICGKRINMSPSGNDHKAMIGYMKEHGWGHKECHDRSQPFCPVVAWT